MSNLTGYRGPVTDRTEADFIAGIAERPDEDYLRLEYADWLDEHAGTVECKHAALSAACLKLARGERA